MNLPLQYLVSRILIHSFPLVLARRVDLEPRVPLLFMIQGDKTAQVLQQSHDRQLQWEG